MIHLSSFIKKVFPAICMLGFSCFLYAQTPQTQPVSQSAPKEKADEETLKQANNPLASVKSFNVHNYYVPILYGAKDVMMNQAWLRYAQPIGNFIIRASLPIVTSSTRSENPVSGLGDLNAFVIYKFKLKNEGIELGVGPALTFPTGTRNLGSGKWQAGASVIAFFKSNPIIQIGSLLTWQMSYAGDGDRNDVNILTPQIFFMWQIGGGTYLRSTGTWSFNFVDGSYNIPIGLGIGKTFKAGKIIFNVFMEPQYSVFAWGTNQPQLQIFAGFNTQF